MPQQTRIKAADLRRLRQEKGHTQPSLAAESGVSVSQISHFETSSPDASARPTTARALADALNVSWGDIAYLADPRPAPAPAPA